MGQANIETMLCVLRDFIRAKNGARASLPKGKEIMHCEDDPPLLVYRA